MAITRQNINTQQMPPEYNRGCCDKRKKEKTITIYKNRSTAEDAITRMVLPTGAIDVAYYRDAYRNLRCLLIVGNIPHNAPFIFENDMYVGTAMDSSVNGGSGNSGSSDSGSGGSSDSSSSSTDTTWDGQFDTSVSWDIVVTPDDDESEHIYVETSWDTDW